MPLSKTRSELLLVLISQRYERGATLITSPTDRRMGPKVDETVHRVLGVLLVLALPGTSRPRV